MKTSTAKQLAEIFGISTTDSLQAIWKAKLISAILKAAEKRELTHAEIAKKSGVPRSAIAGILNGSLQKVSLDRVLRLLEAVHLTAELKIKEAA